MKDELTIFDFSTKELTQDAFLLWLFNSLSSDYEKDDVKLLAKKFLLDFLQGSVKVGEKLVNVEINELTQKKTETLSEEETDKIEERLWALEGQIPKRKELKSYLRGIKKDTDALDIKEMKVKKQYKKIDVLLLFKCGDTDIAMAIEDKVATSTHEAGKSGKNQLEKYRDTVIDVFPDRLFLGIYYKNRIALDLEKEHALKYGYAPFTLEAIQNILSDDLCDNHIIKAYKKYIDTIWMSSYPNSKPRNLNDMCFSNDEFYEKNRKMIFWGSYFVDLANRLLDMENNVETVYVQEKEIEVPKNRWYRYKDIKNAICNYGPNEENTYYEYRISLEDFPLGVTYNTRYGVNPLKFDLYSIDKKPQTEECRKIVHDKFKDWVEKQNALDVTLNNYPQQIGTWEMNIPEDKYTCEYFEEEYIKAVVKVLKEIRDI